MAGEKRTNGVTGSHEEPRGIIISDEAHLS